MSQKILFVDDEPNVINSLRRTLQKESFEILSAFSGQEALQLLSEHIVDVVISDEQMPGMSGTELLSRISKSYPDTVRIVLTGNANIDMAVRAINEGQIYRFLRKPCHELELIAIIHAALQHREFLQKTKELLKLYRQQSGYVAQLENRFPGISDVQKDEKGTVVLTDIPDNYENLIKEIENELGKSRRKKQYQLLG
ncbi:MAG TPA: response regulator [Bacteroidetes bacterium]|nr:response regulator [Bacteroidota bacterium]